VSDERPPVSALVVAHNEEANLADCLAKLAFAGETVVVLDRCTDRSKAIALSHGAKIVEGAWPFEGDRRNAGIAACSHDWILEVDADERVTPALASEITTVLKTAEPGCFLVGYDNFIGRRHVRFGWGAYNGVTVKWSLFHRACKVWGNQSVHPEIDIKGKRGRLTAPMIHYVDQSLTDLFNRLNRYSDLAARDAAAKGGAGSGWAAFRRLFSRFWKAYVTRKGYKEGVYGVALGLFAGLYPLLTYLKTQEILEGRERRV
jgi:glycosyltransferase involved in cell wall biosynthesis